MLSKAHVKEKLSVAHLSTLAWFLGYSVKICHDDFYSVDVEIFTWEALSKEADTDDACVFAQLKCSKVSALSSDERNWKYKLNVKNYNDLRKTRVSFPRYLFLYIVPDETSNRVSHSEDQTITRNCMYWLDLRGEPPTTNESTKTVNIPKTNVLTPEKLEEFMIKSQVRQ